MIEETIYLNRDNTIDLSMLADGEPVAIQSTTRVVLKCEEEDAGTLTTLDSDSVPDLFDWATQGSAGTLILKLGDSSLTEANYTVSVFVYNSNVPNGLLWGYFRLIVEDVG